MITTSYSQICLCGRSFDNAGAFTRHKKTCPRGKKRLANALSHAKESYRTKRCRVEESEENASSSQAEGLEAVSHTATSRVSDSVCNLVDTLQPTQTKGPSEVPVSGVDEVWPGALSFASSDLILLEPSDVVQTEHDTLPLSIRRARRANQRLPKRFQDMLPEPPLPLPPQGVEVPFDVGLPDSRPSTTVTSASTNQSSSQADPAAQSARIPSKPRAVLTTQRNSFGLFRVYDEDSVPSINDPEDQSGADPLPTEVCMSQPFPSTMNPFYPYPNESSWRLGDWYWNQGVQKSKDSFKKLVEIITSSDFRSEDLHHINWVAIDCQLGSLSAVHHSSQTGTIVANLEECQAEDGWWMRKNITISIPFPRCSLISNFYCWPLLSIIHKALSDPVRCKSFHFEPYSLRWNRSCKDNDIGIYGELFFFTGVHLCTL